MTSATKLDDFQFCVHSLFCESFLSKSANRLGFIFQPKNSFNFYNGSRCIGSTCLYIYQSSILRPGFLRKLRQFLLNSTADFCYLNNFKTISWKGYKNNFLPFWSPERLLSNFYISPLVVVNRENLGIDSELSYLDFLKRILNAKVAQINLNGLLQISNRMILKKQHKTAVDKILKVIRPLSFITDFDDKLRISNKNYAPDLISIVIPTRGALNDSSEETSIESLIRSLAVQKLENSKVELVIVYDDDTNLDYLTDLEEVSNDLRVKLVSYSPPFNFSKKCNLGAKNSSGEVIIFLNDDTSFISDTAIIELAGTAMLPEIGAVGAKLYFPNNSIQHAGIFVMGGNVGHAYFKQINPNGTYGDLFSVHEVSGVTGACLAQQKEIWESLGGWDIDFSNSYNDVEYCFRIRENGYRILQNNLAELFHYESLTRDPTFSLEAKQMLESKWNNYLVDDVYFPQYVSTQNKRQKFRTLIKKIFRKLGLKK